MSFGFGFSLPAYAGYAASFGPSSFGSGTSLALDFLNGNNTLDPRITFSRTSNAMLTNSAGVLTYAPHNLLTFSEQFDNAAWTKNTATVTANAAVAPDGTATADLITSIGADGYFGRGQSGVSGNRQFTASIYLRSDTPQTIRLYVLETTGGSGGQSVVCNVSTQWQRFSVSLTTGASVTAISTQVGGASSFGTGKAIYAWGYQLNVGALQPYYPTTVKNLLGYTQEFDNAAWTKGDATVSTNTTVAPDGSVTADTITFGTNSTVPSQTVVITGGTPYTISFYVHASSTAPFVRIRASTAAGSVSAFYNVAAGVFGAMNAGFTPGLVVNEGNEWRRVSVQYVPLSPDGGARSMAVSATVADNSSTAATGSTLVLWGAQLSDSARLDPYVYNPVAAPASTAYYGPRFDYDPVTLAPKGLLIEEQRTNLLLQSETFDNASWAKTGSTISANAAVSPDGTQDADKLVENDTAGVQHRLDQAVSTISNQTYVFSFHVKAGETPTFAVQIVAVGSSATTSNVGFYTSGGVITFDGTITGLVSNVGVVAVGSGWYRCSITYTLNGTVTLHQVRLFPRSVAVYTGDGTSGIYIWGAQLEAGSFPTSYIPTTTAAATRAADVAVMTGANFSNWYRQDEGTLFGEFTRLAAITSLYSGGFPRVAEMSDGTTSNNLRLAGFSPAQEGFGVAVSGTDVCTLVFTQPASGTITKLAGTYKLNDFAASMNGSAAVNDTAGAIPAVSVMYIGNRSDGTRNMNGHIRRIAYYPRRLANTELQSITA